MSATNVTPVTAVTAVTTITSVTTITTITPITPELFKLAANDALATLEKDSWRKLHLDLSDCSDAQEVRPARSALALCTA